MPTYAYKCKDCGNPLEAQQAFTDAALTECPVCGGRLRKQYGSVGVTFNGSGFYRTDSRAGDGGKGDGSKGAAKTEGGTSDGAKTDAAPAKTEAPKPSSAPAAAGPSAS
jgi:putative FmdB family regulatory protein